MPNKLWPHGTRRRYQQHCTCPECSKANDDYQTSWRARASQREAKVQRKAEVLALEWLRGYDYQQYLAVRRQAAEIVKTRPTQRYVK